jgi:O-antigen/teichoic acid export membrane protein
VEHLRQSVKITAVILLPVIFLVLVLAEWILRVFFGVDYADNGAALVRILAISSLPFFVNVTYMAIQRIKKKLLNIIVFSGALMLMTLIIARFLLPVMGINGAGIAWLASHSLASLAIIISHLTGRGRKSAGSIREESAKL